jgi:molybdenum cofactor biosynthesis enzyme MoaA
LKTCLYDDGVLNIRDRMRAGVSDEVIKQDLLYAFSHRAKDGFEAEEKRKDHQPVHESMSTIGG